MLQYKQVKKGDINYMKDVRCRDVWWVNMEDIFPQKEHAYKKIRPCVVISNGMNNTYNDYVTIVPLTTKYDGLPQHTDVYVKRVRNYCLPEWTTTVHKDFLLQKYFVISFTQYQRVLDSILVQLDMKGHFFRRKERKL